MERVSTHLESGTLAELEAKYRNAMKVHLLDHDRAAAEACVMEKRGYWLGEREATSSDERWQVQRPASTTRSVRRASSGRRMRKSHLHRARSAGVRACTASGIYSVSRRSCACVPPAVPLAAPARTEPPLWGSARGRVAMSGMATHAVAAATPLLEVRGKPTVTLRDL